MAKILIVEDNEMNMRLFSDLLKTKGHDITECLDGTEALELIKSIKPDLILMDIQMPKISGLAVTAQIRETPEIADTRIVAVSAFAMKGDEEKILEAGCDAYISKPISIPLFFQTVEENLK
ncbi:MAG: response regulator [Alphaproteobacteria bacterium]|nr:response regulator [Alphaproteobacteria bacterium]